MQALSYAKTGAIKPAAGSPPKKGTVPFKKGVICSGNREARPRDCLFRRAAPCILWAALVGLGVSGCATKFDEMTSRDFSFKQLFTAAPAPMDVLRDPNTSKDGEARAKAMTQLQEPRQHGGSQKEQDDLVELLKNAATTDQTPLCRMAAIRTLGHFQDARAAEIVESVYLQKLTFSPDINKAIREQCLASLIETGGPIAEKRLILVAKEPPSSGSEQERLEVLDRRFAAVRGLAKFKDAEAAAALVQVLRTEKDFAMRDGALESLQLCTGKHLPANSPQWEAYAPAPPPDVNLAGSPQPQGTIVSTSAQTTVPVGAK